jgi:hypothetical protein
VVQPRFNQRPCTIFNSDKHLAASRANERTARGSLRNARTATATDVRTRGELAPLVFEHFEQRQSQAEVVIGLRVELEVVRELFEQYCRGLVDSQLDKKNPNGQHEDELDKVSGDDLARRLEALAVGERTRISIGRWRGSCLVGDDPADYAWIVELGGFLVAGPCTIDEITRRYGRGSYRVTAYGFDPSGIRWEVLVKELKA